MAFIGCLCNTTAIAVVIVIVIVIVITDVVAGQQQKEAQYEQRTQQLITELKWARTEGEKAALIGDAKGKLKSEHLFRIQTAIYSDRGNACGYCQVAQRERRMMTT